MAKGIQSEGSRRRLEYWRAIVQRDETAWAPERDRMDWREKLYGGTHQMRATCKAEEELERQGVLKCYHVRNVVAENIESMVDSRVPKPKVYPLNKRDEKLARTLEQLLDDFIKRHHMRVLNDMAERMGPIQGGLGWSVEWDDSIKTPDGPGDVHVGLLHPKQLIPQAGVYTDVEDMDHICVKQAMTVGQVRRRFGVDVDDVMEEDSGARAQDGDSAEEGIVTVWQLWYRNGRGGVGLLAWCGDVILCDHEDHQARRLRRCKACGAVASYTQELEPERRAELKIAGQLPEETERCIWCEGTEFEDVEVDEEQIMPPGRVILSNDGEEIKLEPATVWLDEQERVHYEGGTMVPYYKPDLFPVLVQKNISRFGKLLGESDVDKMDDAQNTVKRLDKKILDRLDKAGTKIILPPEKKLEPTTEDQTAIYLDDPAKASMVRTLEFTGDISKPMDMSNRAYEEARQASGITDSMQGRRDPTATSAKAKEFSASKSEGRMESRRVMKQEAWSKIFERIAKLYLSCADEGRRIRVEQPTGEVEYVQFNRMDYLKQDKEGHLYYEDGFVFTCDDATSIGESREAMWQEINSSFSAGTLGNPQELPTLILYWGLMEEQAYPGAAGIRQKLQERLDQEQAAQQQAAQVPTQPGAGGMDPTAGMDGMPMPMQ